MVRRILLTILGLMLALPAAWWLVAFKPWYNRSLTWRITAVSSDRTVSVLGPTGGYSHNPDFTQVLQDRFPLGSPAAPAISELEANGFHCGRRQSRPAIDCLRAFGPILPTVPVARVWMVSVNLDDHERIENVFGAKYTDGP